MGECSLTGKDHVYSEDSAVCDHCLTPERRRFAAAIRDAMEEYEAYQGGGPVRSSQTITADIAERVRNISRDKNITEGQAATLEAAAAMLDRVAEVRDLHGDSCFNGMQVCGHCEYLAPCPTVYILNERGNQ